MKNVLIYINQICLRGGVEKVFYNLINNLDENKYKITILTTVAYLSDDLYLDIYKGKVKRFYFAYDEFSDKFLIRQYQRIYNKVAKYFIDKIIKCKKWDTAIAAQEGIYAEYINGVKADKKLVWIHNDMRFIKRNNFKTKESEKKCYQCFDKVICVSNTVKESMLEEFGEMDNLCVRYNPIDTNEIDTLCNEEIIEKRSSMPLLVSVGRLCHQKSFERLLSAVKELNGKGYLFEVWIIGEGDQRKNLELYIEENNLKNVKLLGHRRNPFAYMKVADWVICTSKYEGFNTALQEAMYLGKPIFTTLNAGAIELLGQNEYGIIVDNNQDSICNGLRYILDNKNIQLHYKKRAKERKEFVSLEKRISRIEELL